jgi:molecular chaperone GrpE
VTSPHDEHDPVVVRDKRKIDPVTGEARKTTAAEAEQAAAAAAAEAEVPKADALLLEERTRDLQRVQAEYANYRKRAERDRLAAGELAVGRVLSELLPVLDDIDRARQHGDLTGALKAVAEHLGGVMDKLGLVSFGEVGDRFDPAIHEAVLHSESDEVSEPTCTMIMRQGYRHGERLLRPAMVGVTDPVNVAAEPAPAAAAEAAPGAADEAAPAAADEAAAADETVAPDQQAVSDESESRVTDPEAE